MEKKSIPLYKSFFLKPFSLIWEWAYFIRRIFYDYGVFHQKSYLVPVISIGNLTFGGTGKTPFTLWLAKYLQDKDKKVMILMRGYKGKLEKTGGFIDSDKAMSPDPEAYGDEALLYARRLNHASIVVGKKRSENLSFYFPKVEPDVVLLDDGHQHIKIKRKLNIVLFDATMPLVKYEVAPLGYMREGFQALKDADLIVLGKADIAGPKKVESLKKYIKPYLPFGVEFTEIGFKPNGFYNHANDLVLTVDQVRGKKVICLAGIANPQPFFKLIEDLGAEVLVTESFPDHHFFKLDEINALLSYAKSEDAYLVTTEKDMVRIRKVVEDEAILFLEIDVDFLSGKEECLKVIESCLQ
jgi:tetraacyldisaccharide 4'-kinase